MRKPRIFIASSGRAETLASALKIGLNSVLGDRGQAFLWREEIEKLPGVTVTEFLRKFARESDFVAAVLTRDDVSNKQGEEHLAPRDNCIFEAGLFTGALGLDYTRCFLVCSVALQALPSDLRGLQHMQFEEPVLSDDDACRDAIVPVVNKIEAAFRSRKPCCYDPPILPLVSKVDLLEREQLEKGPNGEKTGGSLKKSAVVVNATQPLETDYQFALRVRKNMSYGVNYIYFFYADPDGTGTDFIWQMVQNIALAGQVEGGGTRSFTSDELFKIMADPKFLGNVKDNLERIHQSLAIHFLSSPTSIQFCVHNADSTTEARSYVRYSEDGQFVEFHPSMPSLAKTVADGIMSERLRGHPEVVFRSTRHFDLDAVRNKTFRDSLFKGVSRYFIPELQNKVAEICFGGIHEVAKVG